jgi:dethiobiotin synthetase
MSALKKTYFMTGIGTDIGKTICAAILVDAIEADYWKPIQAGGLELTDTMRVKQLISNKRSVFFKERYQLQQPMSPHAAAKAENIVIALSDFELPQTNNHLVIEGAGGLMVPINDSGDLVIDLIAHLHAEAVLVSHNYLGSINHTLLSVEALKSRNIPIAGIIFNGPANKESESIILKISGLRCLGKIPMSETIVSSFIAEQADQFCSPF